MTVARWLGPLAARLTRPRTRTVPRRPAFRPRVEEMEGRLAPAIDTAVTITPVANPAFTAQPLSYHVTVSAVGLTIIGSALNAAPTGTVRLTADEVDGIWRHFDLGTIPLPTQQYGVNTTSIDLATDLPQGKFSVQASYSPNDPIWNASSATITQTVYPTVPRITVTGPSAPVTVGTSVALTATVQAISAGDSRPTGAVDFMVGSINLGSVPLVPDTPSGFLPPGQTAYGTATLVTTTLPVGTSTVTAVYSGDGVYTGTRTDYTVTVNPPPPTTIDPSQLPAAQVGMAYSQTLTAAGLPGIYAFTVTSGGLPPGLTLTNTGTSAATLTGTPAQSGSFVFTVTATSIGALPGQFSSGTADFVLVVNPEPTVPPPPGSPPTGPSNPPPPPPESSPRPVPVAGPVSVLPGARPVAVGADAGGGPVVKVYDGDGALRFEFFAYEPTFTGGVRVAVTDFDGDGVPDVVTAPGPGGGPLVRVFSGTDGSALAAISVFEPDFTGGLFVAAGDIDRDGYADVAVTADRGGGARVVVISGQYGTAMADFLGIDDPDFRGGSRPAVGDVNGDGTPDLVVAAGFGGGPRLTVWDGQTLTIRTPVRVQMANFFVFEDTLRNGVYVAAGDIDRDGCEDVVVGGGPGGGPRVQALSGSVLAATGSPEAAVLANFFAGDPAMRTGVRVGVWDADGSGYADIVTGAGPGGQTVLAYRGTDQQPVGTLPAFADGFSGGVFVDGAPAAGDLHLLPPADAAARIGSGLRPGGLTTLFLRSVIGAIAGQQAALAELAELTQSEVDLAPLSGPLDAIRRAAEEIVARIETVQNGVADVATVLGLPVTASDLVQSDLTLAGADADAMESLQAAQDQVDAMFESLGKDVQNTPGQLHAQFESSVNMFGPAGAQIIRPAVGPGYLALAYTNGMMKIIGGTIRLAPDIARGKVTPKRAAEAYGGYVTEPILHVAGEKTKELKDKAVERLGDVIKDQAGHLVNGGDQVVEAWDKILEYLEEYGQSDSDSVGDALVNWAAGYFEPTPGPNPGPGTPPTNPGTSPGGLFKTWTSTLTIAEDSWTYTLTISPGGNMDLTIAGPKSQDIPTGTGNGQATVLTDDSISGKLDGDFAVYFWGEPDPVEYMTVYGALFPDGTLRGTVWGTEVTWH